MLSRFRPWINAAAAGAVFLAVAALVLTCPLDGALFTHLAAGDRILSLRSVPRAEEFSYTAYSLPWTDLSWLYQAGIAAARRLGGLGAVGAIHALLWMGIFGALFRRGRPGSSAPWRGAVVLLAAVGCAPWLRPGPEVVSWALLLAALAILESGSEGGDRRRRLLLWGALPGLVLLWVNVHQAFLLAPVATFLVAIDRVISGLGRGNRGEGRSAAIPMLAADLAFSVALQCGAALLNPFGARGLRLPFDASLDPLGANALLARVFDDWRPVLSGGLPAPQWLAAGLLALLALALTLRRAGRGGISEAVLLLVLLVLALRARRHLPPMLLAAAFFALRPRTLREDDPRRTRWQAAAAALLVAAGVVVAIGALRPSGWPPARRPAPSFIPATDEFPEMSAGFVAAANLPGQVFHSLPVGGYLFDAWKRDRRIFADGRREPFQHGALRGYLEAVGDEEDFERAADKYQITTVLWPHRDAEPGASLLRHLASGGRWRLVSIDTAASVWVRVDAFTPALARDAPIQGGETLASLVPLLQAQLAARPRPGPPVRESDLARFFAAAGDAAGAEAFFRLALESAPGAAPLWRGLGEALETRQERVDARRAYEKAAGLDAGDGRAAAALGAMALEDGRLDEARLRLDAAARAGDDRASTLAARALLAEKESRADEARSLFAAALRSGGTDRDVLIAAAGFEGRRGELDRALDLYARVRARRPDDPAAAADAAILLEGAGRNTEAFDLVRGPAEGAVSRANASGTMSAEDRRLLEAAARLARRADEPARAAEWEKALEKPSAVGTTPGR